MLYRSLTFKSFILLLIFIFGLCFFTHSQIKSNTTSIEEKQEVQTTITYCDLNLSEEWKLGNLSFNSLYSFTVNQNGEVLDVKKIRDNFIGEEAVKSCISNWKMKGFPEGSQFAVYFVWKHGKGWIRQEISGNGFTQVMTMEDVGVEKLLKSEVKKNR